VHLSFEVCRAGLLMQQPGWLAVSNYQPVFVKLDGVNLLENLGNKKVKKFESLNMNQMSEIANLEYKSKCAPSIKL
jgi:hypothetical protein